jgi:hypothetical protein
LSWPNLLTDVADAVQHVVDLTADSAFAPGAAPVNGTMVGHAKQ